MVQEHQGRPELAPASLKKAVALAPKEPRARVAYAALLTKRSLFQEAIAQYEALLCLRPPPRIE
ncbi:MAG: hypothetical protein GY811_02150 [Myxococcales bacterium]|nr:hypothetical protein [Myxococcales bacterium]